MRKLREFIALVGFKRFVVLVFLVVVTTTIAAFWHFQTEAAEPNFAVRKERRGR
jgi:hypothetical protein